MTTKRKFDVERPECVLLRNGRFAYRCDCPWEGKNGKKLRAFKFCSKDAYNEYQTGQDGAESEHGSESEHEEGKHTPDRPRSPESA